MSNICKCDICGQVIRPYSGFILMNDTILGNHKIADICKNCLGRLEEMKNEREKSDQHS